MKVRRIGGAVAIAVVLSMGVAFLRAQSPTPAPTRVVEYAPASLSNAAAKAATCGPSYAAWFHKDTLACFVDKAAYDPCFVAGRVGYAVCGVDPRQPSSGVVVTTKPDLALDFVMGGIKLVHHSWFFELTDGTTCQPLAAGVGGRELDGLVELYKCKWGSSGEADAVLGDLDESLPVWTIRKVSINKKTEPQTIKSMTIATVKSVWR